MIRVGDWRDVLPGTYDPERSVVVTDPPFGLGGRGASIAGDRHGVERGFVDDRPWAEHVRDVLAMLPAVRHVVRGPAPAFVRDHPRPRRLCVEVATGFRRTLYRPGTVDHAWTGWAVYGKLRVVNRERRMPRDVVLVGDASAPARAVPSVGGVRHRGMTPYPAAAWAVATWVPPGWTVVDPYAGTATIGLAALELGCDYLGVEIDPRWAAVGVSQLEHTPLRLGV